MSSKIPMPIEYLDIINEADEVIGQGSFEEVHAQNLLHRFARVLVMNDQNELVLHRRPVYLSDAGMLDSAGGHVESGEDYLDCAVRELEEEMGISLTRDEFKYLGQIRYQNLKPPKPDNMLGKVYLVQHNGPYTPQEEEVDGEFVCLSLKEVQQEIEKGSVSDKVVQSLKYLEK